MTATDWRRVEEVYHAAAALPADRRGVFLDGACAEDAALRSEVESLLGYANTDAFIEEPALNVAARLMSAEWVETAESLTGMSLGQFRILERIGAGGMGVVYEAEDLKLGRKVALKFLPPWVGTNARALERFEREARAASALNHPGICTIYSVQHHEDRPFIEMERLEGRTLRERAGEAMTTTEVVAIAMQLADALEAAHRKGIVHRDLKPANIFCTARGVKILDFGIAKLESLPDAEAGDVIGTVGYMSPEQQAGHPVDRRTDLFSLGAVMRELIAPAPKSLDRIIQKAMAGDPDRRYQSAAALLADLERFHRDQSRRPWRWIAAAAVLVLLVGAAAARYLALTPSDLFGGDLRLRQVTHNASEFSVGSGAISPDGRYVAYADPRGIHLLTIATNVTRRIEFAGVRDDVAWDVTAGWLPNGSQFVVNVASPSRSGNVDTWIASLTGPPIKIRDAAHALSVSPDGAWIAFMESGRRARTIFAMDQAGTQTRTLFDVEPGSTILGLSWSPDSSHVAYGRGDDAGVPVSVEARDIVGGPPSTVFQPTGSDLLQGAAWLRDGRLLYSLTRPALGTNAGAVPCSHWQVPLDNRGRRLGAPTTLAGWLPQCVAGLSFTADTKRALYLQRALQDVIIVAAVDGGTNRRPAAKRLTSTEGRNIPSGWTRDSQGLVFFSDGSGGAALYRQAIDGDSPQMITSEAGIFGAARLSPDGASVLYLLSPTGPGTGTQRLMRAPITGGESQEVHRSSFVDGGARCAAPPASLCVIAERAGDGREVVFSALDPVRGRGQEMYRIASASGADFRWALSPNGDRLAILKINTPSVRIVQLEDGSTQDVSVAGATRLGYVSWLPTGNELLVPSITANGAELLAVGLEGATRMVWEQHGALDISGIPSPDGQHVAIWIRTRNASLWLAESP